MKVDHIEKLKYIETHFDVEKIEYNGIKIWPFFRTKIIVDYFYSGGNPLNSPKKKMNLFKIFFEVVKTTSFPLIFKKKSNIIYASDLSVRMLDDAYIERNLNFIYENEKNRTTFFQKNNFHKLAWKEKYVNMHFFNVIVMGFLILFNRFNPKKMKHQEILDEILNYLELSYSYLSKFRNIDVMVRFYRWYLKKIKPQKIYVICYYDIYRMPALYVAKELGIPIIELQHGIIYSHHYAYIGFKEITPNPFPDYLFAYGEKFKSYVSPVIYKPEQIFITGSYYLNLMLQRKEINQKRFNEKYAGVEGKIIVTIASQTDLDREILSFFEKVSDLTSDFFFIFLPRIFLPYHENYQHPNIAMEKDLDVYQCMQNSHLTTAVVSTCCLESLSFGVPALLVNINNLVEKTYKELLKGIHSICYVNTEDEYIKMAYKMVRMDKQKIETEGNLFFASGYEERFKKTMELLGLPIE